MVAAVLLMLASFMGSIAIPKITAAPPIDGTLIDPAWKNAAVAHLSYDLRTHQPASDATTDYIMTDGTYLYVGVDAQQAIPVRAIQHTNDVGVDTDDEVQIDLWPNGTSGFQYLFITTALGTHYQFSSENNSFEPTWYSVGKLVPGGFTVTMKIPLNIMHSSGSGNWRVQFARLIEATNNDLVWSYGPSQQNHNDVNYAGLVTGLPQLAAYRAKPRIGIYGLGAVASRVAGGSTSRAGVDLSIPTIPGTSFVATLHPDYSDVEQDQQTISPTAFQRQFNEVRPFFTQGANFYNNTPNCTDCPGTQLYTPAIPTPRDGYAIEGKRGLFSYAGFEAVGVGRSDTAQVVNYASPNQQNALTMQRNGVNYAGFRDDSFNVSFTHDNLKNFATWVRYANDSGTNVLAGNQAQRYERRREFLHADEFHSSRAAQSRTVFQSGRRPDLPPGHRGLRGQRVQAVQIPFVIVAEGIRRASRLAALPRAPRRIGSKQYGRVDLVHHAQSAEFTADGWFAIPFAQ